MFVAQVTVFVDMDDLGLVVGGIDIAVDDEFAFSGFWRGGRFRDRLGCGPRPGFGGLDYLRLGLAPAGRLDGFRLIAHLLGRRH